MGTGTDNRSGTVYFLLYYINPPSAKLYEGQVAEYRSCVWPVCRLCAGRSDHQGAGRTECKELRDGQPAAGHRQQPGGKRAPSDAGWVSSLLHSRACCNRAPPSYYIGTVARRHVIYRAPAHCSSLVGLMQWALDRSHPASSAFLPFLASSDLRVGYCGLLAARLYVPCMSRRQAAGDPPVFCRRPDESISLGFCSKCIGRARGRYCLCRRRHCSSRRHVKPSAAGQGCLQRGGGACTGVCLADLCQTVHGRAIGIQQCN